MATKPERAEPKKGIIKWKRKKQQKNNRATKVCETYDIIMITICDQKSKPDLVRSKSVD